MLCVTGLFFVVVHLKKTEDKELTIYLLPSKESCWMGHCKLALGATLNHKKTCSYGSNIYQWLRLKAKGSLEEVVQPESRLQEVQNTSQKHHARG